VIWPFKRESGGAREAGQVESALRRGSDFQRSGDLGAAEECYRQVLSLHPEDPGASRLLAPLLALRAQEHQERGEIDAAIEGYEESLALDHGQAQVHNNLGNAYKGLGRLEDALASFRQAIVLDGALAEAHLNLATVLYQTTGRCEQAIAHCRSAVALRPSFAEANLSLGFLLEQEGDAPGAEECYRKAIAARPDYADAHLSLGRMLNQKGQLGQAIAHCRAALAIRPDFADASLTLGNLLEKEGDAAGARDCYRAAFTSKPDFVEAHFNYALQSLLLGDYATGWKEYEWRTRIPNLDRPWPYADRDHWDGGPLEGKAILLHAEQGFGDSIQFMRYAPLVAERGGKVIVSCQAKLKSLFQDVQGVSVVLTEEERHPPFDVCSSLMSLPRIFETTIATIPARLPYIRPDPAKALSWKSRLAAHGASLKVGLVWATDTRNVSSPLRSTTLDTLSPLAGIPGVTYFSLQQGAAAGEAAQPPSGMALVDLGSELKDFSDTAALISNFDLIISIDTAIVHVAGALGLPVWTLVHFPPDPRWLLGRDDSPWYPTMRLFRKGRTDDWSQVVARVAQALRQRVEHGAGTA